MAALAVRTLGRQVIAEFYACDAELLEDPDRLRRHLRKAAARIGATVISEAFHRFEPGGVSGTLVIAESHLSIHTWPEQRYAAVDLFTCGGLDPRPGFALLGRALGAATGRMQEIVRGLPEELEHAGALLPEDVLVLARSSDVVSFAATGDVPEELPRLGPERLIAGDGALPEGKELGASRGDFDGEWLTETFRGSSRFGIRVERVLHEEQSPFQRIAVYETPAFGRVLTLDGLVMLTERDEFLYHEMIAHVPLVTIASPRSVLIIGGGDCGTLREVLRHPGVARVVQCEIDERVTRVSADAFSWVAGAIADQRSELVFADGVRYLEGCRGDFDLVIVDSTDPIGPAAALFRAEFYRSAAHALREGGVLCAQTESPFWAADLVAEIYGEIRQAFRHVSPFSGFVPTYPSGAWSWAWASNHKSHDAFVDTARAEAIAEQSRYYNLDRHRAAFALPSST
jgi:spermidine synthase